MGLYNLLSGVLPLRTQLDTGRVWPIYFCHKMFFCIILQFHLDLMGRRGCRGRSLSRKAPLVFKPCVLRVLSKATLLNSVVIW